MEVCRGPDYQFYKVNLYPTRRSPQVTYEPFGTAEIAIFGHKGWIKCRTCECLDRFSETHVQFPVILVKECEEETIVIGSLAPDQSGCGVYKWDFVAIRPDDENSDVEPVAYKLLITVKQDSGFQGEKIGSILMEGMFTLKSEIRDSRIVGFKREAKVKKKPREIYEKNLLIQKVEPFQPPIPNCSWWQINIQPDLGNRYWYTGFCPRQKSKIVF